VSIELLNVSVSIELLVCSAEKAKAKQEKLPSFKAFIDQQSVEL